MALIACPECTRQISTHAAACPYCGYPMQVKATAQSKPTASQLRNCMDCGGNGKQPKTCNCCDGTGLNSCSTCMRSGVYFLNGKWGPCPACDGILPPPYPCAGCAGQGHTLIKCETCGGSGQLTLQQFDSIQHMRDEEARKTRVRAEAEAKTRAETEAKRKDEEHAKWLADAPRRNAEEKARQDALRRSQDKKEEEERKSIQEARLKAGCCEYCGHTLSLTDNLADRKHHDGCTFHPQYQYEDVHRMMVCRRCKCAVSYAGSERFPELAFLFVHIVEMKCSKCHTTTKSYKGIHLSF